MGRSLPAGALRWQWRTSSQGEQQGYLPRGVESLMRDHRRLLPFRLIVVVVSVLLANLPRLQAQDSELDRIDGDSVVALAREVADSLGLSQAVAAVLRPVRLSDEVIAVDVPLSDAPIRLLLQRTSVRSPDYHLVVQESDGSMVEHTPGAEHTYRGTVEGIDGSVVAASIDGATIYALVLIPGRKRIWIEPARGSVAVGVDGLHAVYDDRAVEERGRCGFEARGLDTESAIVAELSNPSFPVDATVSDLPNNTWFAELGIDTDVEFFDRFGSVEATEARINSIINTVNVQYERDVGIQHTISHMIIRTSPFVNYSSRSANTLLFEFSDYWFRFQSDVQRDTAHLFTGKSLSEGIVGLANFSGICSTLEGYGLSGYNKVCSGGTNLGQLCGSGADCPGASCIDGVCQSFACRTDVTAHELGHNWAAPHCPAPDFCPGWTMHPSIQGANRFHPDITIPKILAYRDTVTSCLTQGDILNGLTIDPLSAVLAGGNELQFTAMANFQYGIDKDVTTLATWSVDRPGIASIDSGGRFIAGAVASAQVVNVTADFTFDGMFQQGSTSVTVQPAPLAPMVDPDTPEKNRYISLIPPPSQGPIALQVTLVSLQRPVPPNSPLFPPFNFESSEGNVLWVGPPEICADIAGGSRDYFCASLSCEPYYSDNWGDQVIHITGAEIMPSSIYDVRTVPASCSGVEATCVFVSPPVRVETQRWGDVVAPFQEKSPDLVSAEQPNINDAVVVIDRVKQLPTSFLKPLVHLWSLGNGLDIHSDVTVLDITSVVDALKGRAYPFFGPCDCPSPARCPSVDRCGRCTPP